MLLFEIGLPKLDSECKELARQNLHEEIAASASRLQKARINALGLPLDEIQHRLDKPCGRENLSVVSDTLL
jgi:hypothetical protein